MPVRPVGPLLVFALAFLVSCAPSTNLVRFPASAAARVDLSSMHRLGVYCRITSKEANTGLDRRNISARIADNVADIIRVLPDKSITSHDELAWLFRTSRADSALLLSPENARRLREELGIDGLVLIDLDRLDARLQRPQYPVVVPGTDYYAPAPPSVYLAIEITFRLIDVKTRSESWKRTYKGSGIEPARLSILGGGTEQQVMEALAPALRQFTLQVLPRKYEAVRGFAVSD